MVDGLQPSEARWTFLVPPETPRMVARFGGEEPIAMPPPQIRTVLLEPDEDRVTLVWVSEAVPSVRPGAIAFRSFSTR